MLISGSEPGEYDVQILDSGLVSRASSAGTARMRDFATVLEVSLDTSALPPGSYEFAVRRHDADWRLYPLKIE